MIWTNFINDLLEVAETLFSYWIRFYTWINSHPVIFFGFFVVFLAPVFLWFFGYLNTHILNKDISFDNNIPRFYTKKMKENISYNNFVNKKLLYEMFNERYKTEFGSSDTFEKYEENRALKIDRNMKFSKKNEELLYQEYAQKRKQNENFAKRYKKENSADNDLISQWNNS